MINKGDLASGDIVWTNFDPSMGHEYKKKRPALVVQSDTKLSLSSLATVIPLSSVVTKANADDILITKDTSNNLYRDSLLKVYCISSFDYSRFEKKIGSVSSEQIENVKTYLKLHFNLT